MHHYPSLAPLSLLNDRLKTALSSSALGATDPIHEAGTAATCILRTHPSAARALAHEKLHVFPFKDVPTCWRRLYEEACLWEVLLLLWRSDAANENGAEGTKDTHEDGKRRESREDEIIALCDMALILTGAPGRKDVIDMVLSALDGTGECKAETQGIDGSPFDEQDEEQELPHARKRRKLSDGASSPNTATKPFRARVQKPSPRIGDSTSIQRVDNPSLTYFQKHVASPATPIIFTNTIEHWPARTRWKHPRYWLTHTHQGRRLVPVELGQSYTDEGWGQRIMRFGEFLETYMVPSKDSSPPEAPEEKNNVNTAYLAQHDLLAQIPSLRRDIAIPDYCYVSPAEQASSERSVPPGSEADDHSPQTPQEPLLNIWLGPPDTVSPAHTDPHHNIFAQVVGSKYVRLFAPSETAKVYPMQGGGDDKAGDDNSEDAGNGQHLGVDMGNTTRVDVGAFLAFGDEYQGTEKEERAAKRREQEAKFPLHASAEYVEGILGPGECLYIPRGWWHYIWSLDTSCSVSFWWD